MCCNKTAAASACAGAASSNNSCITSKVREAYCVEKCTRLESAFSSSLNDPRAVNIPQKSVGPLAHVLTAATGSGWEVGRCRPRIRHGNAELDLADAMQYLYHYSHCTELSGSLGISLHVFELFGRQGIRLYVRDSSFAGLFHG